ncbi:MAG: glycosyltransferase family 39 protein [Bacteroidales bacterium]|nr:glycosyltransferase family 39 protein [Bacteroidales bacterium]
MANKIKTKGQKQATGIKFQIIVPLLIVFAAFFVYNPATNNGILHGWDDTEYLLDKGVQDFNLKEIFTNYHLGMYQPLSVFTIAVDFHNTRLQGAKAHHIGNLLWHIINILLVWVFVRKLTGKNTIAGVAAFLFALHPMNVEAVAWIAARSTLLFTACYIGGLLTYLKYTENKKPLYFGLTILLAALALFSKSLAISFPFVLFIIDYYKGRTWSIKLFLEKAPFLILSIIFGIITIKAAQTFGHITELQHDYSLINRFFILCYTFVFYLVKLVAPIDLSSIYSYPGLRGGSLPWLYYLSALLPLGLIWLIYHYWKKQKKLIAGILFFSITIAPVLPLFWSRVFIAADRYAYLSFIGLFLIAGILIDRLINKKYISNIIIRYGIAGILIVYGVFLMYSTNKQCSYWKDGETLLTHAVTLSESAPAKALAYFYRGNIRQGIAEKKHMEGQQSNNEGMVRNAFLYFGNAIRDYDSTLAYNPQYMLAYSNRGIIYGTLANYDQKYQEMAWNDFDAAIQIDSGYADNYYNKAWLLYMKGDLTTACELWQKADRLGSVVAIQALEQYCR